MRPRASPSSRAGLWNLKDLYTPLEPHHQAARWDPDTAGGFQFQENTTSSAEADTVNAELPGKLPALTSLPVIGRK